MKKLALICLLGLSASSAFAGELTVSGGSTYLRGQTDVFAVTYTTPLKFDLARKYKIKLETSLVYIDESVIWNRDQPAKWILMARGSKRFGRFDLVFGGSAATKTDDYNGSKLNFSESLRFHINDHWRIEVMHNSNAGFKSPNMGRDILLAGYDW